MSGAFARLCRGSVVVALAAAFASGCDKTEGEVADLETPAAAVPSAPEVAEAPEPAEPVPTKPASVEGATPEVLDTPKAEAKPTDPPSAGPDSDEDATLASAQVAKLDEGVEAEAVEAAETTQDPEPAELEKRKILILGDSLAATGFGALLERKLDARSDVVCYRKGKSASGLARPDFFDWIAEGKRQIALRDPHLVVVIMGGNDGQDIARRVKGERRVPWKHEDWDERYRARMDEFLSEISGEGRTILWLGLPTMGLRSLEKKLVGIRAIQKAAVDALGDGAVYLDTAPFVSNDDGGMLTHAEVGPRKKTQKIRAEDRIHFTMAGSRYFADKVYPSVLGALGLPADAENDE